MQNNKFKLMGVVNITPDSFSDPGKNFDNQSILNTLNDFNKYNIVAYDFGAESTAPFNKPIDSHEEIARFEENLIPILDKVIENKKTISIDTYKPDVFALLADKILSVDSSANIIWNDVSGIVDDETNSLLKQYPQVSYVLSHNLAISRDQTSHHMDYIKDDLVTSDVSSFFKEGLSRLKHKKVILDPCFGFSKTFDQNWMIINELSGLVKEFDHPWLLGVSRKSFLKRLVDNLGPNLPLSYTENLHVLVLSKWAQELPQGCYFIRLHDAAVGQLAVLGQQVLT